MNNLNIYFSDSCNSNCTYCIMKNNPHNSNSVIRNALSNGVFAQKVISAITPDTISLGIWGMEPTINGDLFKDFIYTILTNSPNIKYIMLPTNGQSVNLYEQFILPLYNYCEFHERKLILMIQFSLDGPPDLHNAHRGEWSAFRCINNIYKIDDLLPQSNYFKVRLSTKSTLTGDDILYYDPKIWEEYMLKLNGSLTTIPMKDNKIGTTGITLEVPGHYTQEHGIALCKWKYLCQFLARELKETCLTSSNSKTIDYQGNLYDCHLLCNRNMDLARVRADFDIKYNSLRKKKLIAEQDKERLYDAIIKMYCWAASPVIDESYLLLLGNGVLKEG